MRLGRLTASHRCLEVAQEIVDESNATELALEEVES